MDRMNRRKLLGSAAAGAGALALGRVAIGAKGANEKVVVGLIGCGGRGRGVARTFAGRDDAAVAWVCDPDRERLARGEKDLSGAKATPDLRKILDDKAVDAVVIATPDHWHGPATVLACKAGKHVYVEKPCSHNLREGRLMVEAARKHKRVVQVGTQSRSGEGLIEAVGLLRDGAIGEVLVAKAVNSQLRRNIGHGKPGRPPAGLEYDLWVGPAPFVPYQANRLHYNWHWWYAFGTGDIGNDGVHELDVARWGLGVDDRHPASASGHAAKLFFDDDQEFPDTYYVTFDYPPAGRGKQRRILIYEQRIWSPYGQEGFENGCMFYGTKGMMLASKGEGYRLFGPRNQPVKDRKDSAGTAPHVADFVDAIRIGCTPRAEIEVGHRSAALAHLANIVARTGRAVTFNGRTERIVGDEQAGKLIGRMYREGHWAVPI